MTINEAIIIRKRQGNPQSSNIHFCKILQQKFSKNLHEQLQVSKNSYKTIEKIIENKKKNKLREIRSDLAVGNR